jgi:hypothetical protein
MKHQITRCIYAAVLTVILLMMTGICPAQQATSSSAPQVKQPPAIQPEAMDALEKMGKFLQTLRTFAVSAEISVDEVLISGQKIMTNGTSQLTVQRPNQIHAKIKVDEIDKDLQFFYDGKTFTLYGNKNKYYASLAVPGTIEEMIEVTGGRLGIEIPLEDLFVWGTDKARTGDIQEAFYIASTQIGDVLCDHYAFRQADVDWQIWIEKGDTPLPIKIVITTKLEEGSPQHVSVLKWNLSPVIEDQLFVFVPPKDSYKIKFAEIETTTESTN